MKNRTKIMFLNFLTLLFQTIPKFRGKLRLMRFVLNMLKLKNKKFKVYSRYLKQEVLFPDARELQALETLAYGTYERETVDALSVGLRNNPIIVDVGANLGLVSLGLARELKGRGSVVAIEGAPNVLPFLKENLSQTKHTNIRLVNSLVYNSKKMVNFFLSASPKFGMGSLWTPMSNKTIKLPARTLTSILKELKITHVDSIKIDVEGGEVEVLEGAVKLLKSENAPRVVFEYYSWTEKNKNRADKLTARAFLESMGYDIWNISDFLSGKPPLKHGSRCIEGMLVAEKRKSRAKAA